MSSTRTREATLEDASRVYDLACELAEAIGDKPPGFEWFEARLGELLQEPRARILVAEAGETGQVEGAASLWIKPDLAHGDTVVEVPMLVVSGRFRRKGVGRSLLAEIGGICTENDASLIELVATRHNTPARRFYRSLGFTETDNLSLEFAGNFSDLEN